MTLSQSRLLGYFNFDVCVCDFLSLVRSILRVLSSSSAKTSVTNAKFEVEKFDCTNNFIMWHCEVLDVLCQQELDVALEEKSDMMDDKE